ncbi:MAG: ribosome maturation factor RimM [Brucellaceae bacterium]|nr:ribosome maturation factor RimM [Brucellaceae bacterium]
MDDPKNSVLMAVIGAAHGIKGEVRVRSFTDDPLALAGYPSLVDRTGRAFEIVGARLQKNVLVTRFRGVDDRTAAEALNGTELFVDRAAIDATLDEDEYLHADLIGLAVTDGTGASWGKVLALHDFGGGDILEIGGKGRHAVMIPFTRAAVPEVDIANGRILVDPLAAGLVDAGEPDSDETP